MVPPGHWWSALSPRFADEEEPFELALRDRVLVGTTAASDVLLRTVGASLVGSLALPIGFHPLEIRRAFRDLDFYGPIAESGDPSRFFHAPPDGVRVERRAARWPRLWPRGGVCEDLSFDSPFVPINPRLRRSYLRHRRNRRAHARFWRHPGPPRPTIMAIHGFSADLTLLNEYVFALPWLFEMGYDVMLFTLPFHGRRQTRLSPFSGHGFFAGGPSRINEAVAQAVHDFRIYLDWLERERGVKQVGVTGVSLGGFTCAVLAAVEPRLRFSIPHVPVASLPDLALEWQPLGGAIRAGLFAMRRSIADARLLTAVSSPLTWRAVLPRERLMIVAGVGDRLAPPKHSRVLWDHWGRCPIHWFPGSHVVHLDRGEYLREINRFLRRADFRRAG